MSIIGINHTLRPGQMSYSELFDFISAMHITENDYVTLVINQTFGTFEQQETWANRIKEIKCKRLVLKNSTPKHTAIWWLEEILKADQWDEVQIISNHPSYAFVTFDAIMGIRKLKKFLGGCTLVQIKLPNNVTTYATELLMAQCDANAKGLD